jgi:hypothetical protein
MFAPLFFVVGPLIVVLGVLNRGNRFTDPEHRDKIDPYDPETW